MKVIIADDEVNVCRLICNLVDWRSFGMEIVGIAHNGVEALELIEKLNPDLIVTDIRMPGCDGLEMIHKAKELNSNLQFIIISGYRHFEYAQRAIRSGVVDFLLKPIKKEELSATLQKMGSRHRERQEQLTQEEASQRRQQSDRDKLRQMLLTQLLDKSVPVGSMTTEALNQEYYYQFKAGMLRWFVAKLDYPVEFHYQNAGKALLSKLSGRLQTLLSPICFDLQMIQEGSRIHGILNFGDEEAVNIRRQIKMALDEFLVQISVFENMNLTIALGEAVGQASLLEKSLNTAQSAMMSRLVTGPDRIIEDVVAGDGPDVSGFLSELNKRMEAAVEHLDSAFLTQAVRDFARQSEGLDGRVLTELAIGLHRTCLTMLQTKFGGLEGIDATCEGFSVKIDLCATAAALYELLGGALADSIEETLSRVQQLEKRPIRSAKQYISENYARTITLEELAEVAGFNPTYFSTLFKKECGQTFHDYLFEVRMNRAKEKLKETNQTVASICQEVGYSDLKHFTQSFKKHTGLKPGEYRKLFS